MTAETVILTPDAEPAPAPAENRPTKSVKRAERTERAERAERAEHAQDASPDVGPDLPPVRQPPAPASAPEPDLIDRMVDYLRDILDPALLEEVQADLRAEFAGESLYIPRVGQTARQQRVATVLRLFNGRNATEVARRLGISRATVYRALKQAR